MELWLLILGIAAALVLLIAIGGSLFFFDFAVRRKSKRKNDLPARIDLWSDLRPLMKEGREWIQAQPLERGEITSFDGLRLNAFILPAGTESDRVVLMMHGFRSQDFNDFTNSVRYFHENGFHVILADQRTHGESEGKYITYGVRERYDCRDWVNFAVKRFGAQSKIFLMGVSMGSATILMSLGLDLPKNVRGVIADCGFTSPEEIFRHVIWKSYHLPVFPFVWLAGLLCKWRAGFEIDEYSTMEALKNSQIPVLFIHGEEDTFVPIWMSKKNYAACTAPKELLLIPQAKHAMSFLLQPDTCWKTIAAFVGRCLGEDICE